MHFPSLAPTRFAPDPAARLGGSGGYSLQGDTVVLNADLHWLNDTAVSDNWALQLWACPAGAAGTEQATKVAELPLAVGSGMPHRVEATTQALPPAGRAPCTMVLALSAGPSYDTVHDYLVFPRAEQFSQPCFEGPVGYNFDGQQVHLNAACVRNPREAGNLSGSLALELWALPAAYAGGAFVGHAVGSVAIGRLEGQSDFMNLNRSIDAATLPAGRWTLCLMLREWTAAGWLTRDYANFDLPYEVPAEPAVSTEAPAAPEASEVPKPVQAATPQDEARPVVAPTQKADEAVDPAKSDQSAAPAPATPMAPVAKPVASKAAVAKPTEAVKTAVVAGGVSVNRVTETQLLQVKGMTRPVAKAIIAGRPYRTLDALIEVKGVGPKLLASLRASLSL